MTNHTFEKEFSVKANGKFKCRVFNELNKLVTETDWRPNLILNSGLDKISNIPWATAFQWCVSGTNGTPTKRELTDVNATWSGTSVTHASGTFSFEAADVGRILYFPSTDQALKITAYNSSTSVTVDQSTGSPVIGLIKVFHVEQTDLFSPHSMNMSYETSEGMCGTIINGTSVKMTRTFNFYMEKNPVYIRELGFLEAPNSPELFSRVVLETPLYLSSGQYLQVSYELTVNLTPKTVTSRTIDVTGWPIAPATNTSGSECIQRLGIAIVGGDGVAVPYDESHLCNEPFSPGTTFLGPEYGFINRWKNSPSSSPIKIYDPAPSNPFARRTAPFDVRNRYYKLNYSSSIGKNYVYTASGSIQTIWGTQGGGGVVAIIADVMSPVCAPPNATPNSDWNGIDPYTVFPNQVPYTGIGSWDNWTDSGSIGGSGTGSVKGASVFISTVSTAHAVTGSCVDRSVQCYEVPLVKEPYVTGSFEIIKKGTFLQNMANRTDWRAIGVGPTSMQVSPPDRKDAAKFNGYCFIFDQTQTKLNTHNLNIYFKYTWNRDLSQA